MWPPSFDLNSPSRDDAEGHLDWCDLAHGSITEVADDVGSRQIWLPSHYEPGYQYPLIVWLQSSAGDDLSRWMPAISDRNYIAIAAAGPQRLRALSGQSAWPVDRTAVPTAIACIDAAVESATGMFPIHPDRIFIAGEGDAAALALTAGLVHPQRFAGAVAIDPGPAPLMFLLREFRRLQGRRACLALRSTRPSRSAEELYDLLVTAGVAVAPLGPEDLPRQLDAWLLRTACGPSVVE